MLRSIGENKYAEELNKRIIIDYEDEKPVFNSYEFLTIIDELIDDG